MISKSLFKMVLLFCLVLGGSYTMGRLFLKYPDPPNLASQYRPSGQNSNSSSIPIPLSAPPSQVNCEIDKCVALTFDDGPDPDLTPKYLAILAKENVKATFFVIGSSLNSFPDITKKTHKLGHKICNHTWNHADLANMSEESALKQLNRTQKEIIKIIGPNSKCFRAPYGSLPIGLIKATTWLHIGWQADSDDYFRTDSDSLVNHVLNQVYHNEDPIILFHDIHKVGLKSVPTIIRKLKDKGYKFVTVDELNLKLHNPNTGENPIKP
jgi:peptidoglycan-N-acetylglucosamine deacetylase